MCFCLILILFSHPYNEGFYQGIAFAILNLRYLWRLIFLPRLFLELFVKWNMGSGTCFVLVLLCVTNLYPFSISEHYTMTYANYLLSSPSLIMKSIQMQVATFDALEAPLVQGTPAYLHAHRIEVTILGVISG